METAILGSVASALLISCVSLAWLLWRSRAECRSLRDSYAPIADQLEEVSRLKGECRDLERAISEKRAEWEREVDSTVEEIESLARQLDDLRDAHEIQSFGMYEPQFDFDSPEAFKDAIRGNRSEQKGMVRSKDAAVCDTEWTVSGSKAKGKTFVNRTLKLMLRAFNGECDAAIAKCRFDNVDRLRERLERSFEAINKLGETNECRITRDYLMLRTQELRLSYEHAVAKNNAKEKQRAIREQMREEEKVLKETRKAELEAEKEEMRFEKALIKARAELEKTRDEKREALREHIALLEKQFEEAHNKKAKAVARAQLTRSGHVYVISNIGSFGERMFKVGMTRRLEPLDRVKELGDASVPFPFDVHAMIYSDDAPALESGLHERLEVNRINLVNRRREFFELELDQLRDLVKEVAPDSEFISTAVAEQFRESLAIHKQREREREQLAERQEAREVEDAKRTVERLKEKWKADPL